MTELVCTEPGLGIELGTTFQVLSENGSEWEILLGNEYRRINKRSGRVTGWKTPPKFECKDIQKQNWLITSCRSANNIMPITIFLPAGTASFFYSA